MFEMIELTEERSGALSELINIGFGLSMGSLADILGIFIELSVPRVQMVRSHELIYVLVDSIDEKEEVTLINQNFRGDFFGEAVLALPKKASHTLADILDKNCGFRPEMEMDKLEMEALLELGNVVIGACLGKFAELLNTSISFSPPRIFLDNIALDRFKEKTPISDRIVLVIHTNFNLENKEVSGCLLIFLDENCLEWLFSAVDSFIKQFE
jgi:chemotaxis protein CheC